MHGIMSLNKLTRGIEFTVKGMVQDKEYFSASLAVRRVLARELYNNNVQLLEEMYHTQKADSRTGISFLFISAALSFENRM